MAKIFDPYAWSINQPKVPAVRIQMLHPDASENSGKPEAAFQFPCATINLLPFFRGFADLKTRDYQFHPDRGKVIMAISFLMNIFRLIIQTT
jgi:hypothetical protein